jgi:uncharacterized protein YciI
MFIIDLKYIVPLEEVDQHMAAHVVHLEKHYANGAFVAWGRKEPRTGGVILAIADSKDQIENIIKEDPFHQHQLAEFTITELLLSKHHPNLTELLQG